MLERLGSAWGGWTIDLSLVQPGDVILSAGLSDDITFDMALLNKCPNICIIGIDPTDISIKYIQKRFSNGSLKQESYHFYPNALMAEHDQECIIDGCKCRSIGINHMLDKYSFAHIKLDIEGHEYEIINTLSALTVKQFMVEFHHWVDGSRYSIQDTRKCINKLKSLGYSLVYHKVNVPNRIIQECLFVRSESTSLNDLEI